MIQQNLLDSHDTGRILTLFESKNPPFESWDAYFNWPKAANNTALKTHQPGFEAKQALKLATVWQMTGPGAPMIYYGTEVGMWGAQDPDNRQPMLWKDLPAYQETQGFYKTLPEESTRAPDMDLFAFYQQMIAIRKDEPALRRGTFKWLPSPDETTLAYQREFDGVALLCVIHKGNETIQVEIPHAGRDLWMDEALPAGPVQVPANGFRIIRL